MSRMFLAALFIFALHSVWAEEPSTAPDDDSAQASDGKDMKETGGYVNMEPQTDYDAPDREPANDDGDKGDGDSDDHSEE